MLSKALVSDPVGTLSGIVRHCQALSEIVSLLSILDSVIQNGIVEQRAIVC